MKKKISRIMGVVLTAVLLASLVAVPVSATISQPSVALGDNDISDPSEYVIMFQVTEALDVTDTITVEFPAGTEVPATFADANVTIISTPGFGTARSGDVGAECAVTDEEVVITLTDMGGDIAEYAMVKITFLVGAGIENPDDPDDYTLTVATEEETTAVESAPYTIEAPDVGGLPGIVQVFNPSEILISQTTGDDAIANAITAAGEDFVIKIGPGTYTVDGVDDTFDTEDNGVTFMATGAADATIIDTKDSAAIVIDNDGITLDGLTFQGQVYVSGEETTITDCIFEKSDDVDEFLLFYDLTSDDADFDDTCDVTDCTFDTTNEDADDDIAVVAVTDGLTVSGCSFILDDDDIGVGFDVDTKVKDSEFTGSSAVGVGVGGGTSTVSGCTFDGLDNAINMDGGTLTVKGNTIINCTGDKYDGTYGADANGGAIHVQNASELLVYGNTISDTDENEYAVVVENDAEDVFIIFNNFSGNEKNIDNNDGDELDCSNNWWGDADGPDSDSISDDVDTSPALGAMIAAAKADADTEDLDAKTDVGVKVSANDDMDIVGAATYADNPGTATDDPAIGYFDVYAVPDDDDLDKMTIRLYGDVTEDSVVMVWSTLEGAWVEASDQGANTFSGYAWCTVEDEDTVPLIEELCGTAFAIVTPPPPDPEGQLPVELVAPAAGITGVQLSPTFAWSDVGTAFYEFQLSDNPYFADPLISDSPKLRAPYFDYPADLEYSKTYFWRVRSSISGATSVCVDTQCGPWAMGIFTTMDEPVAPPEIVFPEPQPPVVIPPVQEITPSWIYVIIGVGALLVIAVIVLIVTTRRATP